MYIELSIIHTYAKQSRSGAFWVFWDLLSFLPTSSAIFKFWSLALKHKKYSKSSHTICVVMGAATVTMFLKDVIGSVKMFSSCYRFGHNVLALHGRIPSLSQHRSLRTQDRCCDRKIVSSLFMSLNKMPPVLTGLILCRHNIQVKVCTRKPALLMILGQHAKSAY